MVTKTRRVLAAILFVGWAVAGCDAILALPNPSRDAGSAATATEGGADGLGEDGARGGPGADGDIASDGSGGSDGSVGATDGDADAGADAIPIADGSPADVTVDSAPPTFCEKQRADASVLFCADFESDSGPATRWGDVKEIADPTAHSQPNALHATSYDGGSATYAPQINIIVPSANQAAYTLHFRLHWQNASVAPLLVARTDWGSDTMEVWAVPQAQANGMIPVTMLIAYRTFAGDGGTSAAATIFATNAGSWDTGWHDLALKFPLGTASATLVVDGTSSTTLSAAAMNASAHPILSLGVFQGTGAGDFDSVLFGVTP